LGKSGPGNHLSHVDRRNGQPVEMRDQPANVQRRSTMKKLFLAVALVVAFAAPAMADQFPNAYSQR
jgi:hypothetical protein